MPFIEKLRKRGIPVSTFIAPDTEQIRASKLAGATHIELHTGYYANGATEEAVAGELAKLRDMAQTAAKLGLRVNAGHGLNYRNARPIAQIEQIEELNIGYSIIGRAALVGIDRAVRDMITLIT